MKEHVIQQAFPKIAEACMSIAASNGAINRVEGSDHVKDKIEQVLCAPGVYVVDLQRLERWLESLTPEQIDVLTDGEDSDITALCATSPQSINGKHDEHVADLFDNFWELLDSPDPEYTGQFRTTFDVFGLTLSDGGRQGDGSWVYHSTAFPHIDFWVDKEDTRVRVAHEEGVKFAIIQDPQQLYQFLDVFIADPVKYLTPQAKCALLLQSRDWAQTKADTGEYEVWLRKHPVPWMAHPYSVHVFKEGNDSPYVAGFGHMGATVMFFTTPDKLAQALDAIG